MGRSRRSAPQYNKLLRNDLLKMLMRSNLKLQEVMNHVIAVIRHLCSSVFPTETRRLGYFPTQHYLLVPFDGSDVSKQVLEALYFPFSREGLLSVSSLFQTPPYFNTSSRSHTWESCFLVPLATEQLLAFSYSFQNSASTLRY